MLMQAMNWTLVAACVAILCADSASACAADAMDVKIMTFNIRYENTGDGPNVWSLRRELAGGVIRRFDPDFVGLQEAMPGQIADITRMFPAYRLLGRSRNADSKSGEAVPILYRESRWRLDDKQHGTFWLSGTPEVPGSKMWGNTLPRVVTWARFVDKQTGRGLYVYNTHFDHQSEPARQKSAALVGKRIAEREGREPVLLVGDFNADESSSAIKYLTGQSSESPVKLIDTFREIHPAGKHVGTFHDFRGGEDGEKIDFILASPGVKVRSAGIVREHRDRLYPSDHYPVTAEVTLPQ
jgi:endonuclease/exonuclease/phosphatase family metal-dependent hydrolase